MMGGVLCAAQESIAPNSAQATQPPAAPEPAQTAPAANAPAAATLPPAQLRDAKQPTGSERRRAAKLYLEAAKLFQKGQFEEAMRDDQQAASLDPSNGDYRLAVEVARSHAVTALVQTAARDRMQGDTAAARAAIAHAAELDPQNPLVTEHLREFVDTPLPDEVSAQNDRVAEGLGTMIDVEPSAGTHSFHLHENQRQVIAEVFKAYGIAVTFDETIRGNMLRFDIDDATFGEATRALGMATMSFYVPVDAHRALVALDTRSNRSEFTRNGVETIYLAGLTGTEMTDIGNLARNVFEVTQSAIDPTAGTLTLRAPESQLNAFNTTFRSLMDGRNQVLLDVRLIQLAHTSTRNTGAHLPQQITAFNVFAEEQAILNANQALVQQIISSGLAAPGDTLGILAILLASGQVSSSIFQNGIILFGGGLTLSGVTPQPFSVNFNLNSSDSRELDQFQLRLGDGEEGTLKSGTRYPIETSSFSSLGAGNLNIPGLTGAGTTANLTGLLASLGGASATIPQVQYEDLGLTLKATPSVMRSGEVALKIDLKISALAGSAINGIPILANRAWSGVVTVGQNQGVVVASEMDKQESRAVSGTPGISEIPGLNNATGKDVQKNYSTLLIVMTPHVVRSPRNADHTKMVRIERNFQTH
jgi:general secretion pathway protein D